MVRLLGKRPIRLSPEVFQTILGVSSALCLEVVFLDGVGNHVIEKVVVDLHDGTSTWSDYKKTAALLNWKDPSLNRYCAASGLAKFDWYGTPKVDYGNRGVVLYGNLPQQVIAKIESVRARVVVTGHCFTKTRQEWRAYVGPLEMPRPQWLPISFRSSRSNLPMF